MKKFVRTYKLELIMTLILIAMYIVFQLMTGTALKLVNIKNVLQGAASLMFLVMGQLLVVITGGIDLSVGSIFSLTGIIGCVVMNKTQNIAAGVIVALLFGLIVGIINGLLVSYLNMAPFIVTLATQGIAASICKIIVDGASQTLTVKAFKLFNGGTIIPHVPNYILFMIVLVVVMHFVLRKTLFGRSVYAVGSNEEAARLVGISAKRIKVLCYTLAGILSAVGALLSVSRLMTFECSSGTGMELDAISATCIGGASLSGGLGTAFGATVGTLIQKGISNGINLLGINTFWSGTVTGVVMIIAVLVGGKVASSKSGKKA